MVTCMFTGFCKHFYIKVFYWVGLDHCPVSLSHVLDIDRAALDMESISEKDFFEAFLTAIWKDNGHSNLKKKRLRNYRLWSWERNGSFFSHVLLIHKREY